MPINLAKNSDLRLQAQIGNLHLKLQSGAFSRRISGHKIDIAKAVPETFYELAFEIDDFDLRPSARWNIEIRTPWENIDIRVLVKAGQVLDTPQNYSDRLAAYNDLLGEFGMAVYEPEEGEGEHALAKSMIIGLVELMFAAGANDVRGSEFFFETTSTPALLTPFERYRGKLF